MKKVLIIAHLAYASPRMPGLAKYLPEFGWQPTILTAPIIEKPDSDCELIETEYRDALGIWKKLLGLDSSEDMRLGIKNRLGFISKNLPIDFLLTIGAAISNYPDEAKGWKTLAIEAGSEFLQNNEIDAMISSSSPVTSHIIARELKIKYNIPWIADFRDPWTQNHNYGYGPLRKMIDKRLELKTMLQANALVTVSTPWAEALRSLHGKKRTYAITNGFDQERIENGIISLTSKFTITYTGRVYIKKQDLTNLFAALRDLISDGTMDPNYIEVRFYGLQNESIAKKIEEYGLLDIVKQYGPVPRDISFIKQRESQLLLLLNWDDPQEQGVYPLKVFEYLGALRPILATGGFGSDVVEKLLHETNAGVYAPTAKETKNTLKKLYTEYKNNGEIPYDGMIEKINRYSYREMARQFASILDDII